MTKVRVREMLLSMWQNMTVEPVIVLYCLIINLIAIIGEEFYLKKACRVNLNYTAEVCDNIYEHKDIQIETQKLVSWLQAHSGILQSVPGLVFVLFAGPLSDTYGRKPMIFISLFGYFILSLVYLVNSIWFHELKVEFLLFECLQDLTGGDILFYLATKCYIVDITTEQNRTSRLAILDGIISVGSLMGLPLGPWIKKTYGYTALFSTALVIVIIALFYVVFFLKDSYHYATPAVKKYMEEEKEKSQINCDKDVFGKVFQTSLSSFKTVIKERPYRGRVWILLFIAAMSIPKIVSHGYGVVGFMFYRLQYKIDATSYANLISVFYVFSIPIQLLLVPFLSEKLQIKDTTLMIIGLLPAIPGFLLEAFFTQIWILFVIWGLFYSMWFCVFSSIRSAISKLVQPTEVGKVFAVIGILDAVLGLVSKPLFGFMYQASLGTFPGLWIVISCGIMTVGLIVTIIIHFGRRRSDRERLQQESNNCNKNNV